MSNSAAWEVNEYHQDGWDFCDAVRETAMKRKMTMTNVALIYLSVCGHIPDGYTLSGFRELDVTHPAFEERE